METLTPKYKYKYTPNVITEQIIFESFLSTVKDFAKDKLGKAVNTIKDWKDAAVVFSQVLSSKELLADFISPLERLVKKQLQKLYEILKKLKLDSILKKIEGFFKKITSLDGWKKLFALIAIGGVALYAANKLPIDGIQSWVTKTLGDDFISSITSNLVDWKKYIGFLGPIVGGGAIIFKLLQPLLEAFKEALKSGNKFATKLIKENKNKTMKRSELRKLIKEELNNFNEAEATTDEAGLDTKINISGLVKKLGGVDISKFNAAFKLLQQGKPLGNIQNKTMADTFIALMKNTDEALATQFRSAFKKIQ